MNDNNEEIIQKLISYMDNTAAFAKEQLPDVANQILSYGAIMSWVWLGIFGLLFILCLIMFILCVKSDDSDTQACGLFPLAFIIGSIIGIGSNIGDLVKINAAPKLYIIDTLANKIKE